MPRLICNIVAAGLLSTSIVGIASPVGAATADPTATQQEETYSEVTVEEVQVDKNGNVKGGRTAHVGYVGNSPAQAAAIDEGTSSASGCKTATVYNRERSTLGTLLYTYKTWTTWCWTRSTDRIYNVSTGWDYINDDMCWSWEGEVNNDINFYNWASGYAPISGHLHRRKGHTQGGCLFPNNKYPENYIRAHSNGTWTWDTNG